ncbi:hypothetical protein HAX54_036865, partial [Datura stramonium]|nr:hypothetical protein [Datura stramonium]
PVPTKNREHDSDIVVLFRKSGDHVWEDFAMQRVHCCLLADLNPSPEYSSSSDGVSCDGVEGALAFSLFWFVIYDFFVMKALGSEILGMVMLYLGRENFGFINFL